MKRIFSILLLTSFLFSTVGVIASSYSCNMQKSSCCSKTSNCCTHEVKLLKLKDDFVSTSSSKIFAPVSFIAILPEQIDYVTLRKNSSADYSQSDLPPPDKVLERLSFIQSFLI